MRWFLALALCFVTSAAAAQGCGPSNPGCIVPTAPLGMFDNRAASGLFVQQNSVTTGGLSSAFDTAFGSTRGSILERGAAAWGIVTPGASGLPWVSNGAGADPAYQQLTGAAMPALTGDVTSVAGTVATTIANAAVTGSKIATNTVANSNLVQATANTMKGNWTGSTANEADNAMPSCTDTGSNHLNYVSGTGITCGTADPSAGAWGAYAASPTCGTASITLNSARFKTVSKTTFVEIDLAITALGTCTQVLFNLPATSNSSGAIVGQESVVTGKGVTCRIQGSGQTSVTCNLADGSAVQNLSRYILSGVYENQ